MKTCAIFFLFIAICSGQKITPVSPPHRHAEGPHWDHENNVLYYVDILSRLVVKYDPYTGNRTAVHIPGGDVTLILTVEGRNDQFVATSGKDLIVFTWDGISSHPSSIKVLATVDIDVPLNKFNDGKADKLGRIWAGTTQEDVETPKASFYYFDKKLNYKPIKKLSVTVSNGLAWDETDNIFYYIDTITSIVDVFDYNASKAEISNRRPLFNTHSLNGFPDGMTIDADGNLWVAIWGGSVVAHVNATSGNLMNTYKLPAQHVSSCVWGGRDLDTLYITTSSKDLSKEALKEQPLAGAVFSLTGTGLKGKRSNKVRL